MPGVGVVGGGIVGTTTALLAARAGYEVTLFESEPALWSRASAVNEGKVHLGLVYVLGDAATRRLMLEGAFSFADLVDEALGQPFPWPHHTSAAFTYLVMPATLEGPGGLAARYRDLNDLFGTLGGHHRYLGQAIERIVDPVAGVHEASGLPSFATVERSVDPVALGRALVAAVEAHTSITVRAATTVTEVVADSGAAVEVASLGADGGGGARHRFDALVNAAWVAQPALLPEAERPVRNIRLKAAIRLPRRAGHDAVTLVHGPFGDVVAHRGYTYASWYPAGRLSHEHAVGPAASAEAARSAVGERHDIGRRTVAALADLGLLEADEVPDEVMGDFILGHGDIDIDQRGSALHSRAEFGVRTVGRVLVPTSFKLTTAPLVASLLVDRLGSLVAGPRR